MKVRGGFAALISLLCFMVLVIVGGRANDTTSAELASSENLTVGGAVDPESLPHDHAEGDDHAHADGEDHAHADGEDHAAHADGDDHAHDPADPAHAHDPADPTHAHSTDDPTHAHTDDPTTPTDPTHCHTNCDPTTPTDPTHPHPPTPSVYTQTQLDLLSATQVAISPKYNDVNAAIAAGYASINDAATGWEHYVNNEYLNSPEILNPATIESLVYKVEGANRTLVSGMYILPLGQSLANVPSAFDTVQTPWHIHSNLCWSLNPIRVVGTTSSGAAGCPRGSIYFVTPPMLHVWLEEQPCGWFADLEQAGGDCSQHPH
jgi:hypothetical protein